MTGHKFIVAALAASGITVCSGGDVMYWDNPTGGSWEDPANWSPQQVPGSGDTAVFDLLSQYTVWMPTFGFGTEAWWIEGGTLTFEGYPGAWYSTFQLLVNGFGDVASLTVWDAGFFAGAVGIGMADNALGHLQIVDSEASFITIGVGGPPNSPTLGFGDSGTGLLEILASEIILTDWMFIGVEPGGVGELIVADSFIYDSLPLPSGVGGQIRIGYAGAGLLHATDSWIYPSIDIRGGSSALLENTTVFNTVTVGLNCLLPQGAPPGGLPEGNALLELNGDVPYDSISQAVVGRRGLITGGGYIDELHIAGKVRPGWGANGGAGLLGSFEYTQYAFDCLEPDGSPQTLAGELHINIDGPGSYGEIETIFGDLAGGLVLNFEYDPQPGDAFNIFTAWEGFNGAWDYLVHTPLPGRIVQLDYSSGWQIWVTVEAAATDIAFDDPVYTEIFGGPIAVTAGLFRDDNGSLGDPILGSDLAVVVHVENARSGKTNGRVLVLENDGDNTFEVVPYEVGNDPTDIAAADLLNDDQLELIIANGGDDTITILKRDGKDFVTHAVIPVGANPSAVVAADFQKRGLADIIVANRDDGTILILENQGDGTFIALPPIDVGAEPVDLAMADLNGNGFLDLVVANFGDGTVHVLLNTGGVAVNFLDPGQVINVGGNPSALNVDDYDHDKDIDIAVVVQGTRTIEFFQNNGDGEYEQAMSVPLDGEPQSVTTWDIDGTDTADIAVAIETEDGEIVQIWRNDGEVGEFFFTQMLELGEEDLPLLVEHADVDGDGQDDLITVNRGGALALGQNSTVSVYINQSGGNPADLNGDGVVDALDLQILLDQWGPCPAAVGDCIADINGDGVVDVLDLLILLDNWTG